MNHRPFDRTQKSSSILSYATLAALALLLTACGKDAKDAAKTPAPSSSAKTATALPGFESDEQRVSYGIGFNFGSGVGKQKDFVVDQSALKAGLEASD